MTQDKCHIVFGDLGLTDPHYGFIDYDAIADKWTLNEIKLNEYLCAIANAGANGIRILPWSVWWERPCGIKSQFQAYKMLGGKFDLEEYNDYYFPIMRKIFDIAHKYNLNVWFPLLDNCQLKGDQFRQYSPWVNNVQGIGSFYERAADRFIAGWMRRCVEEFGTEKMFYPFGNETTEPAFEAVCQRVILPIAQDLKLDPATLAFGATMQNQPYLGNGMYGPDTSTLKKLQVLVSLGFGDNYLLNMFREVHNCGGAAADELRPFGHSYHQALHWWGGHPIKVMLSDDGVWDGDSLCDREDDRHVRPSAATLKTMVAYALNTYPHQMNYDGYKYTHLLNFEHLPKGGNLACQCISIRAMADAYKDKFGAYPENVDAHHYTPPSPEPEPEPEPVPTPTNCKCRYWLEDLNFKRWLKCILFGGKKKCRTS